MDQEECTTKKRPIKKRRNRRRIRSWMINKGITEVSIARAMGVSNALVCSTIGGYRNNKKVLSHLLGLGCPPKILALPEELSAWKEGSQ